MEYEYVLVHHGVKGQRWGIRRYQKKDGSLTLLGRRRLAKFEKAELKKKAAAQKEADDKAKAEAEREEKRAKLLKSTDIKELYENRDLLTTNEINERLTRIDAETRMSKVKDAKRFEKVDRVLDLGKKVNEVYEFSQKPVMKAFKKSVLGIDDKPAEKAMDLLTAYKNRKNLSDDQIQKVLNRARNEDAIKKFIEDNNKPLNKAMGLKEAYENRDKISDDDFKKAYARDTLERSAKERIDKDLKAEEDARLAAAERAKSELYVAEQLKNIGDMPVQLLLPEHKD